VSPPRSQGPLARQGSSLPSEAAPLSKEHFLARPDQSKRAPFRMRKRLGCPHVINHVDPWQHL
jgi:hypothetical protein